MPPLRRWLAWGLLLHGACLLGLVSACEALVGWSPPDDPAFDDLRALTAILAAAARALSVPVLGLAIASLVAGLAVWRRLRLWRWLAHAAMAVHAPGLLWCAWIVDRAMLGAGMPGWLGWILWASTALTGLGAVAVGMVATERAWRADAG